MVGLGSYNLSELVNVFSYNYVSTDQRFDVNISGKWDGYYFLNY